LNQLTEDYKNSISFEIDLPADEFQYPFALIFEEGEILLIWTSSEEELGKWTSILDQFATGMPN